MQDMLILHRLEKKLDKLILQKAVDRMTLYKVFYKVLIFSMGTCHSAVHGSVARLKSELLKSLVWFGLVLA